MDFRDLDIATLVADIRARRYSAEEVMRSTLARIDAHNPTLNALVAMADADDLIAAARAVDDRIGRGEEVGPLAGVPVGIKDLEDVRGLPTTFGSALHADDPPARDDSIEVARLRAAGAIIVGKTNTPEFGCKGATDNSLFGATLNPWDPSRSPGGSSGGSSAALAAGLLPLATGSDGGGSIRIPAALCGHSGFKPTQGRVPMGGAPTTGLLAVRGPMTRGLRDTVIALDAVRGDHPGDIFGLPSENAPWLPRFDERRLPARLIWCPTLGFAELDAEVLEVCEAAIGRLAAAGVEVIPLDAVLDEHPLTWWWTMWTTLLARKLEDRVNGPGWERVDPALRGMVEEGLGTRGVDFARSIDICHHFNDRFEAAFAGAPLMLSPTCAGRTPKSGSPGIINGKPTAAWVELTFVYNMTRHPVASIHAGVDSDGMPVGLQVAGRQRMDLDVLCAAGAMEDILGGPGRAPFAGEP